ncbi:hypothetical protein [Phytoactinopolyspora limicola]|uniref:hypothetical protein n=1 Tax=Phytoactinopolyspora limicola TaxID=2715536 RepID=UPI001409C98C|nr:hypothetical protein [Phytoactinopolyspora limicola]
MGKTRFDELPLDELISGFKRARWAALDAYTRGQRDKALNNLHIAMRLAQRIRELGGTVPF